MGVEAVSFLELMNNWRSAAKAALEARLVYERAKAKAALSATAKNAEGREAEVFLASEKEWHAYKLAQIEADANYHVLIERRGSADEGSRS